MLNVFDFRSSKRHEQDTSENVNLFLIAIGLFCFVFDLAIGAKVAIVIPSVFVVVNMLARPLSSKMMNKVMVGNLTLGVFAIILGPYESF